MTSGSMTSGGSSSGHPSEAGVDTGDRIQVTLVGTNPERGFIDFAR